MSGFLHQLARRARQTEPAIHSRAALPYAGLPAWPEPSDLVATSEPVWETRERQGSLEDQRRATESRKSGQEISGPSPLGPPTHIAATPEGTKDKNNEPMQSDAPPAFETGQMQGARVPAPASVSSREFVPLVRPPPDMDRTEGLRGEAASHTTEGDAVRATTEVVATRPKPKKTVPRGRVPERPPAANRLDDDTSFPERPPEVHVSIGRVEVTAATPPAPKRAPARSHKTMPLEEYLQRRVRKTP